MPADLNMASAWSEAVLALAIIIWLLGTVTLSRSGTSVSRRDTITFAGGMLVAAAIFSPPMDALGARSFAFHMTLHLLLIMVAAPLLAWSRPGTAMARIVPLPVFHWHGLEPAWASAALFSTTILVWHVPAAHDWAVAVPAARLLEHLSMLIAALAFWRFVVFAGDTVSRGPAILIVWLVSLQGALISAVIMFAPAQLCGSYADNPLSDQILAGLVMCIPASLVYAGSSVWGLAKLFEHRPNHGR